MKRALGSVLAVVVAMGVAQAEEPSRFPGLLVQTKDGLVALPLERTRYDVELRGPIAVVRQRQVWRCPLREPVDATYVSPLPPDAALIGLSISVGPRHAEAQLQPRSEAWSRYAHASSSGTRALYGESEEGLVEEKIANLRPGDIVEVELRYTSELVALGDGRQLTLPLLVPPRRGRDGKSVPTLRGPTPRVLPDALAWTHRAELMVHATLPQGTTLESPTHTLDVSTTARGTTATFHGGTQPADRDVVLRVRGRSAVVHARGPDFSALAAEVVIPVAPRSHARELHVIVDEGAVQASPRPQAQVAAFLQALKGRARPDDHVVVVRAAVGQLAEAIRAARAQRAKLPRAFVVVTDGAVDDIARVAGAATDRVVVLTVGEATDGGRAGQLARNAGGVVVPAAAGDSGGDVADRVDRALAPSLVDARVRLEGGLAGATLAATPHDSSSGPMTLLATGGDDHRAGTIIVEGKSPSGAMVATRVEIPAAFDDATIASALGAAYARAKLSSLSADDPAGLPIATRFRIASAWTSFVAVDAGAAGPPAARLITVPLPTPFAGPAEASGALSTDRIRPGDPEVAIEAPAGTRRVTLLLPTGELKGCDFDPLRGRWVANFLIDADRSEGLYVVRVLIERADGTIARRLVRYEVDARAPESDMRISPAIVAPGGAAEIIVVPRGRPIVVDAERGDIGDATFGERVRTDVEVVLARLPDGELRELARAADGSYRLRFVAPVARGSYSIAIVARDGARNGARMVRSFDVR